MNLYLNLNNVQTSDKICFEFLLKVEKISKDSLDWIPSPSPSVKIQIISGKVYLKKKSLLTSPSNVLPLNFNQTFPPMI